MLRPLITLTTVHCDLEALARVSVELLQLAMASAEPVVVERRIPVSLVPRGTHGPAPPGHDHGFGAKTGEIDTGMRPTDDHAVEAADREVDGPSGGGQGLTVAPEDRSTTFSIADPVRSSLFGSR